MRVRLPSALALLVLAAALSPAAASATTFCVVDAQCVADGGTAVAGPATGATIDTAISAAGLVAGPDTVQLGPTTFTGVAAVLPAGNAVRLTGRGPDLTRLQGATPSTFVVRDDTTAGEIANLTVEGSPTPAFGIDAKGTLEHVRVTFGPGVGGVALNLSGSVVASDVQIETDPAAGTNGITTSGSTVQSLTDFDIRATIAASAADGTLHLSHGRVRAEIGAHATVQGTITLDQVALSIADLSASHSPTGLDVDGNMTTAGPGAAIAARHVTIVGDGTGTGAKAVQESSSHPSRSSLVTLTDSVVRDFHWALTRYGYAGHGTASISTSYSSYAPSPVVDSGGGSTGVINAGIGNVGAAADPRFVDAPALDFRLAHDSPLIDRGNPVAGGDPLDLSGRARVRDGDGNASAVRDIGAYEYQRLAPVVTASDIPGTVGPGVPVTFSATASDPDGPDETAALALAWAFEDGSTSPGPVATRAFTGLFDHLAHVTATDPTGLTGTANALVRIRSADLGGGGVGDPGDEPPDPPAGGGDRIAPVLGPLALSARTFRAGRAVKAAKGRATAVGTRLRVRSSEAGTATVTVAPRLAGRRVGARCVKPTRTNRRAKACVRLGGARATLKRSVVAGPTTLALTGRTASGRALTAGRYRVTVVVRDGAGNASAARTADITVTTRRRR